MYRWEEKIERSRAMATGWRAETRFSQQRDVGSWGLVCGEELRMTETAVLPQERALGLLAHAFRRAAIALLRTAASIDRARKRGIGGDIPSLTAVRSSRQRGRWADFGRR